MKRRTRALRIGYFLGFYPTYIRSEVEALRQQGHEVHLFFDKPKEEVAQSHWAGILARDEIRVDDYIWHVPKFSRTALHLVAFGRLSARFLSGHFRRTVRLVSFFLKRRSSYLSIGDVYCAFLLADEIRKRQIDYIHAHFAWHNAALAMLVSHLAGPVSFTITVHADDIFHRPNETLLQDVFAHAHRVITISEYNRRYLLDHYPALSAKQNVHVIRCGVATDSRLTRQARVDGRPGLIISGASGLVDKKGVPHMIAAARILKESGHLFTWVVVGEDHGGTLLNRYRSMAGRMGLERCFELRGNVENAAWLELLGTADIFVLACIVTAAGSRDGIPVSMMEAMAVGLPVVAYRTSGIPELVDDGISGLLVDEKDTAALADAIARLLRDPELRRRQGEAALAKVKKSFDVSVTSAQLASLLGSDVDGLVAETPAPSRSGH